MVGLGSDFCDSDVMLELKKMVVLVVGEEFPQIFGQIEDVFAIWSGASFCRHDFSCHFDEVIGAEVQLILLIGHAGQRHDYCRTAVSSRSDLNRHHSECVAVVALSLLEILDSSGDGGFSVDTEHDSVRVRVGLLDKGGDASGLKNFQI